MKFFAALSVLALASNALALPIESETSALAVRAKGKATKAGAAAAKASTAASAGNVNAASAATAAGAGGAAGAATGAGASTAASGASGAAPVAGNGQNGPASSGGASIVAPNTGNSGPVANAASQPGAQPAGNVQAAQQGQSVPSQIAASGGDQLAVDVATTNFAKDANTVSASLNNLNVETDPARLTSMAMRAFDSETDEDNQRSVLAAAAGAQGQNSNALIVQNTPAVLNGLMNVANNPTTQNAQQQVAIMGTIRNANILPSITQLSDSALSNMGSTQKAQAFAPTVQGQQSVTAAQQAAGIPATGTTPVSATGLSNGATTGNTGATGNANGGNNANGNGGNGNGNGGNNGN